MNPLRAAAAAALLLAVAGCSVAGAAGGDGGDDAGKIRVVIGYQSKTINTVTAGTLLRSLGYLEKRLGDRYTVEWQDHDTGAPITAKMVAGKVDIGSMGDYPLLINASRTQGVEAARTELVAVTGYNLRGALNMVVVAKDSEARTLADLRGRRSPPASAPPGTAPWSRRWRRPGSTR
nr:hypothetical protein GCM10020093_010800 [Planobispora longispora]